MKIMFSYKGYIELTHFHTGAKKQKYIQVSKIKKKKSQVEAKDIYMKTRFIGVKPLPK